MQLSGGHSKIDESFHVVSRRKEIDVNCQVSVIKSQRSVVSCYIVFERKHPKAKWNKAKQVEIGNEER